MSPHLFEVSYKSQLHALINFLPRKPLWAGLHLAACLGCI